MEKIKHIAKDKDLHFALIASFILGLLAHAYAFFNIIFSHDSLIMFQNDVKFQMGIGRLLHWFIFKFRGNYYVPWLVGFIGIAFIAFTAYLVFKIFDIKENWQKILIVGILCVNRVVIKTIEVYIHDFDIYMIALFFSTLGAYILIKNKGNFLKQSLSVIPFFISLGLYPAFIQFGIGILMMYIIMDLLKNKEELNVVLKRGFTYVFYILMGLMLYFIGTKVSVRLFNIEMSDGYNSVGNLKELNSISRVLHALKITYISMFEFYLRVHTFNRVLTIVLNVILVFSGIYFGIMLIKEKKLNFKSILTLILVIALLPLGLNLSCFLSSGMAHLLMLYALMLVYVLYILLMDMYFKEVKKDETKISNTFKTFLLILSFIVIFNNIVYANQMYYNKELEFRKTTNLFNRIITRIEQVDGYEKGKTQVYFLNGALLSNEEQYGKLSVTYQTTYEWFIRGAMAYNMHVSLNGLNELSKEELEYVKTMSVYPKKDSIKYKNGKILVKVSN